MGVRIYERFPGQWWLWVTHKGQRTAKPVGSHETALAAKKIIEDQLALGLFVFPQKSQPKPKELPKPTISEYFKTFSETTLKTSVMESTADGYESNFTVHILPALGDYRIDRIKVAHVERFIADLVVKKGLAKGTIQKILQQLSGLFASAVRHELVAVNPASRLGKSYRSAPVRHERIEPLIEEEVPTFLSEVLKSRHTRKHYALFLTAIHTGLRAGEIAGLEWADIDFRSAFASIERSYDRVRDRIVPTKTKKIRRVDLSDELLQALVELRKSRREEWLRRGKLRQELIRAGLWDEALSVPKAVFCSETGGRIDVSNLSRRHFHACLAAAKLKRRRFHDLRHTFASLHLTRGTPIKYVSEQMGHASIRLTADLYGHLEPGRNRHHANALPGLRPKNLQQTCNRAENAASGTGGFVVDFPVSGNESKELSGAGNGIRTRDFNLGKVALYH